MVVSSDTLKESGKDMMGIQKAFVISAAQGSARLYRLFLGFIANSWSNQESFHAVEMDEQAMRLIRDWIDQMPENQIGMAMDCFRMTRRQQGRSLANVNAAFRRERHSEPQP